MKQIIFNLLKKELNRLNLKDSGFSIEEPPNSALGDYSTNIALKLSGTAKRSPKDLAESLVDALLKNQLFQSVKVEGPGFINFKLSQRVLAENIGQVLQRGSKFGSGKYGKGERVLIEYFQPNIAKPLHLGHLRTAIIGDSLFKIIEFVGYKPESDTHVGDWGTQFGLLLYAYKQWGDDTVIEKNPIEELNKLYIRINEKIEKKPELREAGKAEFVKLEQGDRENKKIWKRFVDWSLPEFEKVYELLDIRRHDHNWGESFYEDKMADVVRKLEKNGLSEESQGAKIINLEPYKLGTAIVIKSDGGTTYLLRDLATFIFRKSKKYKTQLYVVDVRQEHTFRQMFKILELLGEYDKSGGKSSHVSYGFLSTEKGIFSTRKGNNVGPVELVGEAQKKVEKIIKEKNPNLKNREKVVRQVALGAIKYFDLSHNRTSNIVFAWEKVLDFEGNSGPYLQYAHARIKSILRKAKPKIKTRNFDQLVLPEERTVMVRLARFSEIVESAAENYMPHYIAEYLHKLAGEFNQFYQNVRVLDEKDLKTKEARLALISATAQVLKNGLNLLGIEAPEEM